MAISMVPFKTTSFLQDPYEQWKAPVEMLEMQKNILDAIEKVNLIMFEIRGDFGGIRWLR